MKAPCFIWMCFFCFVAGCCLITCGTFLVTYQYKFDDIKAKQYKEIFYPVGPDSVFVTGIALIVAGVLLLIRFLGFFGGFEQRRGCCSGPSRQIRKELYWMVYGRLPRASPPPQSGEKPHHVEVCLDRDRLNGGSILHRHGKIAVRSDSDLQAYLPYVVDRSEGRHFHRGSRLFKVPHRYRFSRPGSREHDRRPDYCTRKDLGGDYRGAALHHHEYVVCSSAGSRSTISGSHYGRGKDHVHLRETGTERAHKPRRGHPRHRHRHRRRHPHRHSDTALDRRREGRMDRKSKLSGFRRLQRVASIHSLSTISTMSSSSGGNRYYHRKRYVGVRSPNGHIPKPREFYPVEELSKNWKGGVAAKEDQESYGEAIAKISDDDDFEHVESPEARGATLARGDENTGTPQDEGQKDAMLSDVDGEGNASKNYLTTGTAVDVSKLGSPKLGVQPGLQNREEALWNDEQSKAEAGAEEEVSSRDGDGNKETSRNVEDLSFAQEEPAPRSVAISPASQQLISDAPIEITRTISRPMVAASRKQGGVHITERVRVVEDVTVVDLMPSDMMR